MTIRILAPSSSFSIKMTCPPIFLQEPSSNFRQISMLYRKITKQTDQNNIQHDLDRLINWAQSWQITFNPSKCEVMHITRSKLQYNTIQYNTIQYNTIQYNTIQYNTIQYNTIQYNTIQYNTIKLYCPEPGNSCCSVRHHKI